MSNEERRERVAVTAPRTVSVPDYEHHVAGQVHGEAHAYGVAYRSILVAASRAGAVEGDPRWYGINIALRAIMELRNQ